MVVNVMRSAFKFGPKYRVTMLTGENWTKGTGASPAVKRLVCFTGGSRMREGTGHAVYGQSVGRLGFTLGGYAIAFQAEICATLPCVCEIQLQNRWEKYKKVSDLIQAALKALQTVRTSPLVQQC
jgi:uncharacterized protein YdbL (DUF1318 family)